MLRALIGIKSEAQLFDPTQPLKFNRVDQANHQPAFSTVFAQRNDVVNRIAIDSLGQFFGPANGIGSAVYHTIRPLPCGCQTRSKLCTEAQTLDFRSKTEFSDLYSPRIAFKTMYLRPESPPQPYGTLIA